MTIRGRNLNTRNGTAIVAHTNCRTLSRQRAKATLQINKQTTQQTDRHRPTYQTQKHRNVSRRSANRRNPYDMHWPMRTEQTLFDDPRWLSNHKIDSNTHHASHTISQPNRRTFSVETKPFGKPRCQHEVTPRSRRESPELRPNREKQSQ